MLRTSENGHYKMKPNMKVRFYFAICQPKVKFEKRSGGNFSNNKFKDIFLSSFVISGNSERHLKVAKNR